MTLVKCPQGHVVDPVRNRSAYCAGCRKHWNYGNLSRTSDLEVRDRVKFHPSFPNDPDELTWRGTVISRVPGHTSDSPPLIWVRWDNGRDIPCTRDVLVRV